MAPIVHHGDCLAVLPTFAENSIDCCITDPPYGLKFMGKEWDHGVPGVPFWREVYRVLKPGAHLLAFGGTRTYHRLAVAIEDAGFEIRDCVRSLNGQDHYPAWVYGQGFPKSLDVSKAIDKAAGADRVVIGVRGGGMSVKAKGVHNFNGRDVDNGVAMSSTVTTTAPATPEAAKWEGWGTALKPAWEPIVVARKPLIGTVVDNVLAYGTGALNIDGCLVPSEGGRHRHGEASQDSRYTDQGGTNFAMKPGPRGGGPKGRWPANLIHDGSETLLQEFAAFGDRSSPWIGNRKGVGAKGGRMFGGAEQRAVAKQEYADTGTAARFFYSAKAGKADRAGSKHPTIKPLALIRYLCRLVCPPGGVVLDPFAGSGTTLQAAREEGFGAIGIEFVAEHVADINRRLGIEQPRSRYIQIIEELLCAS